MSIGEGVQWLLDEGSAVGVRKEEVLLNVYPSSWVKLWECFVVSMASLMMRGR